MREHVNTALNTDMKLRLGCTVLNLGTHGKYFKHSCGPEPRKRGFRLRKTFKKCCKRFDKALARMKVLKLRKT
jgi:hypothetical protein